MSTRLFVFVAAMLMLSEYISAQELRPTASMVYKHCGALPITSGQDFERLQVVAKRVAGGSESGIPIVLIDSGVINAWTARMDGRRSVVCIPLALVEWQQGADGELAFIVGHEIGHALDNSCRTIEGRRRLARKSHSLGALLFGSSNGDEAGDLRKCELRADGLGLERLTRAGYDPQDAVNAFERLRALRRDKRKGVLGRMAAIGSDHPITSDRIHHLKRLIAATEAAR